MHYFLSALIWELIPFRWVDSLILFLNTKWKSVFGDKTERLSNQAPAKIVSLPGEILLKIGSFCTYTTILSLGSSCKAFRNLPHELTLVRNIAETVYRDSQFNKAGTWSAGHLQLEDAKCISIAVEMTVRSAENPELPLVDFLRSRIILAINSHPLTGFTDLNVLQSCLHVARYYKLDDVIPDIAFCLVAATLERGVLENKFSTLEPIIAGPSESLVVIAFLTVNLQQDSLGDIREILPRPRLSLIPFKDLLGETPSLLSGRDSMKHFNRHLQSLMSPSFLEGQWFGVYLQNWDNLYAFDSVQSITRNDQNRLKVSTMLNQRHLNIESEEFMMTPFGLVVFWEGPTWLWKEEWCNDNFSSVRTFYDGRQKVGLTSYSVKLTLANNFWALIDGTDGHLVFHKDQFNLNDARAMMDLSNRIGVTTA